jgi:alpha-glucosidase
VDTAPPLVACRPNGHKVQYAKFGARFSLRSAFDGLATYSWTLSSNTGEQMMGKRTRFLIVITSLSVIVGAANPLWAEPAADQVQVLSPDGNVQLKFLLDQGRLDYTITFKNKAVIERSRVQFSVDGADLSQGLELGSVERYQVKETYPWRGVHCQAVNNCNGVRISLKHSKSNTSYTLDARSFNDAAAFRYIIPGGESVRVPDEATTFVIPAGSTVWYHDLEGHYEGVHEKNDVADIRAGQWVAPPMTFKLPGGAGYSSITEAALVNYSGMALQCDGNRGFNLVLGHKHHVSYPYRLRYKDEIERVSRPAAISGTITSPWRVVMIGADLNTLVNCDVVHNLCPPPDPNLFPEGINTDWVRPGRAVWRYLDGGGSSLEDMKEFSRLAGQLGFEYHVIEGFWSRWSDEQIKELVDYSRRQGVGLWFWRHSRELRTPEAREAFFKRLHDLGVVGAKIDFFDHEHKDVIDHYTALLKEAAKYHVLVNFHGANKPTGEARTWPNEMVREAVRGMEASKLADRATHDVTLPFTRYLAGHGDYTPVHFGARRANTTWTHQIATAAVFTSPLLTYAAQPANILKNPGVEMIKSIPAVWDETIVLPVSQIGEIAAFARRSGDTWFLAILNGIVTRTVQVPLSFLGQGQYRAMLVRDDKDNDAALRIENETLNQKDTLSVDLRAGGGFIARFWPGFHSPEPTAENPRLRGDRLAPAEAGAAEEKSKLKIPASSAHSAVKTLADYAGVGRHRADWMRDPASREAKQARWGVMTHYLADWRAKVDNEKMSAENWNDMVDHFDVEGLAKQIESVGAGYYLITIGQNSGYYLAPNATYDKLVGTQPSKCSRRDLVADLYEPLHKHGIKLMVYLPAGAPAGDQAARDALQWQNGPNPNKEFQFKWEQVIREWSTRWGDKVVGWWFDGCYWPNTMYRSKEAPNFESFAAAARAGNTESIVAFNPGVVPRIISVTPYEDYTAGEINDPNRVEIRRAVDGKIDGAQVHILSFLGQRWGMGSPRFTTEQVVEWSRKITEAGGAVTWDVPIQRSGLISQPFMDQLTAIGKALGRR